MKNVEMFTRILLSILLINTSYAQTPTNASEILSGICKDSGLSYLGSCGLQSSCSSLVNSTLSGSKPENTSCSDKVLLQTACLLDLPLIISSANVQGLAVSACSSIIKSCHLATGASDSDLSTNTTSTDSTASCAVLRGILPTSRMASLTREICITHPNLLPCQSCISQMQTLANTTSNSTTSNTTMSASSSAAGLFCPRLLDTYTSACQILSGVKECEPWKQMCDLTPLPAAMVRFCPESPPTSLASEQLQANISSTNTTSSSSSSRSSARSLPPYLVSANTTIFNTSAPSPTEPDEYNRDPETKMYLHTGTLDYILFRDLVPRTKVQYLGACLFTFALSGLFFVVGWIRRVRTRVHARHRRTLRDKEREQEKGADMEEKDLKRANSRKEEPKILSPSPKISHRSSLLPTTNIPDDPSPVDAGTRSPLITNEILAVDMGEDHIAPPSPKIDTVDSPHPSVSIPMASSSGPDQFQSHTPNSMYPTSIFSFGSQTQAGDVGDMDDDSLSQRTLTMSNTRRPFFPRQKFGLSRLSNATRRLTRVTPALSPNPSRFGSPALSTRSNTSLSSRSKSTKLRGWYLSVELHHIERAFWRTFEVFLGYCLILIVMTFNAGFLLAALLGVLVGSYTLERTSNASANGTSTTSGSSAGVFGVLNVGTLSRKWTTMSMRRNTRK